MKSKNFKVFYYNNRKCRFNYKVFNSAVKEYRVAKKITLKKTISIITEKIPISFHAVRNWLRGYNGPSNIEDIITVAIILGKEPFEFLVILSDDIEAPIISDIKDVRFNSNEKIEINSTSINNDAIKGINKTISISIRVIKRLLLNVKKQTESLSKTVQIKALKIALILVISTIFVGWIYAIDIVLIGCVLESIVTLYGCFLIFYPIVEMIKTFYGS